LPDFDTSLRWPSVSLQVANWPEDLKAGTLAVIPTPGIKLHSSYGFIHLKNRALSPAR
jgi:hypothetical protein